MKKLIALLSAAVLVAGLTGCSKNIEIVGEDDGPVVSTQTDASALGEKSPSQLDVAIPVDYPKSADEIDFELADMITSDEATDKSTAAVFSSADVYRYNNWDVFRSRNKDNPTLYVSIPYENEFYVCHYYEGTLHRVFSGDKTWYFSGGEPDFVVYTYSVDEKDFVTLCTFYTANGDKLFCRADDRYYDAQNNLLSSSQVDELRQKYSGATEFPSRAELEAENNIPLDEKSPAKKDLTIPIDYPLSTVDFDLKSGREILQEETMSPEIAGILGADVIVRYNGWDVYYFTETQVPAQYVCIPYNGEFYLCYYYNANIEKIFCGDMTWYIKDGAVDFAVYTCDTDADGYARFCTFYDADGNKVFGRSGYEYFDADNMDVLGSAVETYRARFSGAIEFDYRPYAKD